MWNLHVRRTHSLAEAGKRGKCIAIGQRISTNGRLQQKRPAARRNLDAFKNARPGTAKGFCLAEFSKKKGRIGSSRGLGPSDQLTWIHLKP